MLAVEPCRSDLAAAASRSRVSSSEPEQDPLLANEELAAEAPRDEPEDR